MLSTVNLVSWRNGETRANLANREPPNRVTLAKLRERLCFSWSGQFSAIPL